MRISCCRSRTMKWCTANGRCWKKCRETTGRNLRTCGFCMDICTRIRVKSFFFFQAEDGIRDLYVTGVQTCALPISHSCGAPLNFGVRPSESMSAASKTLLIVLSILATRAAASDPGVAYAPASAPLDPQEGGGTTSCGADNPRVVFLGTNDELLIRQSCDYAKTIAEKCE